MRLQFKSCTSECVYVTPGAEWRVAARAQEGGVYVTVFLFDCEIHKALYVHGPSLSECAQKALDAIVDRVRKACA